MGVTWSQFFPPKPTFSVDDIPDLTGQVMIVTGGNTGIGKETVKALLAHNATVYLAARSPDKANRTIQDLKSQTGKDAAFLEMDLADLPSIKRAVEEFTTQEKRLHVLFNNGGVMRPPVDLLTTQGYDLQFGTNVLGHFYLTQLLLPTLISTAKETGKPARVVHTSSIQLHSKDIDYATLRGDNATLRTKVGTSFLYQQSKLGNLVLSNELHRRYADQGIVSVALNPGNLNTELGRHLPAVARVILRPLVYPPSYGALTQLWAGTTPEGATFGGKFLFPWARLGTAPESASTPAAGKDLWTWCEEQVANV